MEALPLCFPGSTRSRAPIKTGAEKIQQTGETCKNLLVSAKPGTPARPEQREARPALGFFSWKSWKVISHQGMMQPSAPIIYPGWVNVGTLSSAAEGCLRRDPPPAAKHCPPAIYLTSALSFCAWFGSARLSVAAWMWFVFLLSCH